MVWCVVVGVVCGIEVDDVGGIVVGGCVDEEYVWVFFVGEFEDVVVCWIVLVFYYGFVGFCCDDV